MQARVRECQSNCITCQAAVSAGKGGAELRAQFHYKKFTHDNNAPTQTLHETPVVWQKC